MPKDKNDNLDNTEATPEKISPEPYRKMATRGRGTQGPNFDGANAGHADADRVDIVEGTRSTAIAGKLPTDLSFSLRNIRSLNAKCFFCKKMDCDQVFVAKSLSPGKTRAYAVHSVCIFDHAQLQDLPSEGL